MPSRVELAPVPLHALQYSNGLNWIDCNGMTRALVLTAGDHVHDLMSDVLYVCSFNIGFGLCPY